MGLLRGIIWLLIVGMLIFLGIQRYKKGQWMAVVWMIVGIGVLVYAGLGLMLFFGQSRMLYQAGTEYNSTPDDIGLPFTPVTLSTPDGEKLAAWYIPAACGQAQWTVLYCHGNAGNISHRLHTLLLIHELGANCLIVDYRGYGQSTGKPTEKGTITDVKTAWDWLVNEQGVSPEQIVLFGRSLGGSIAAIAAVDLKPAAVILESTFTSVVDTGKHYYPWFPIRLFARYNYNTLKAVKKLKCPVFITHSKEDEIIPYKFGEQLFEAANEPKIFRELKGTHNEGFFDNSELYKSIWQDWVDALKQRNALNDLKWLNECTGQRTAQLIALDKSYRTDSIVLAFEQAINRKAEQFGTDGLTEAERFVLAICALEREVNNGGYLQFFDNPSKKYAPIVVNALKAINCPQVAELTQQAIGIIEIEEELNDEIKEQLEDCSSRYYSIAGDLSGPLLSYIKDNQDQIIIGKD